LEIISFLSPTCPAFIATVSSRKFRDGRTCFLARFVPSRWTEIDPVIHELPFESFVYEGMQGLPPVTVDAGRRNAERIVGEHLREFGKNNTAFVAPVSGINRGS
jgi:hypothetical protein